MYAGNRNLHQLESLFLCTLQKYDYKSRIPGKAEPPCGIFVLRACLFLPNDIFSHHAPTAFIYGLGTYRLSLST